MAHHRLLEQYVWFRREDQHAMHKSRSQQASRNVLHTQASIEGQLVLGCNPFREPLAYLPDSSPCRISLRCGFRPFPLSTQHQMRSALQPFMLCHPCARSGRDLLLPPPPRAGSCVWRYAASRDASFDKRSCLANRHFTELQGPHVPSSSPSGFKIISATLAQWLGYCLPKRGWKRQGSWVRV